MMPKRAFGTGKTISKNVVYSSFSRPESACHILSVIFGTASNICLHFVASFSLTKNEYSLFYEQHSSCGVKYFGVGIITLDQRILHNN